jgi:hypothetical protein
MNSKLMRGLKRQVVNKVIETKVVDELIEEFDKSRISVFEEKQEFFERKGMRSQVTRKNYER